MTMHHRPQVEGVTIRRRPVGASSPSPAPVAVSRDDAVGDLLDDYFALPVSKTAAHDDRKYPPPYTADALRVDTQIHGHRRPSSRAASPSHYTLPTPTLSALPPLSPAPTPDTPTYPTAVTPDSQFHDDPSPSASSATSSASAKPFWKTAIDETIYFAGGLISHPAESTRHYTVLRHSPGLIYYKGPSTRVTITIFSDDDDNDNNNSDGQGPLAGRTLWLQRKGFSGNMGMDASTFFRTDSAWIDVTPTAQISPAEVKPEDERAWQRDISKFLRKAAGHKRLSKHRPRETCVIRVPAAAADGYMRIVVCDGGGGTTTTATGNGKKKTKKKSLCPSPVFRIASTSRDMSVLRGASATTLPLELGIRAATAVGEKYAKVVAGPAAVAVQAGVKRLEPVTRNPRAKVAMAAVRAGAAGHASTAEERYAPIRCEATAWDALHETDSTDAPPEMVGPDDGPESPFPMHLGGRVVRGTGQSGLHTGFPTANLSGASGELLMRLAGVYIGWAALPVARQPRYDSGARHDWRKAIIIVGPPMYGAVRVAARNTAVVHLIEDPDMAVASPVPDLIDTKLDVVIMAYLRPLLPRDPPPPAALITSVMRENAALANASLSREAWQPGHQAQGLVDSAGAGPLARALKTHKSFGDLAAAAGAGLQRRVDSVPLHWAGVRTEGAGLRDRGFGNGGYYVKRC
ncbi:hypothetical protein Micbo1qcDRAFT_192040 [Microdochium bolleyi]|uniref:Riboflavin kinase n=1 Tax=Microdochium bolleyi TaxID=196109 RepID=A0A136JKG9_9PEZI|nr:hypothetical protein Micbo1qcDRAFT_192040 [Microdochium bolleyi]